MNDIRTFEVDDIGNNNFEITILEKLKLTVCREEVLELFWSLAERLDYETRSKWWSNKIDN